MLLILQGFAICSQTILTIVASFGRSSDIERSAAFFTAVNTRHSGFNVYALQDFKSGTLLVIILMMFLAPAPFVSIMESSNKSKDFELVDNRLAHRFRRLKRLQPNASSSSSSSRGTGDRLLESEEKSIDREHTIDFRDTQTNRRLTSNYQYSARRLSLRLARRASTDTHNLGPKFWSNTDLCIWLQNTVGISYVSELAKQRSLNGRSVAFMEKIDWEELGATKVDSAKIVAAWQTEVRLQEQFEDSDDDEENARFRLDTRLYLMMKYPDKEIPLRVKLSSRMKAVWHGMQQLIRGAISPSMLRDILFLWAIAFIISLFESFDGAKFSIRHHQNGTAIATDDDSINDTSIFYLIFELVSAFGNVGLTLGSLKDSSGSCFAVDLTACSKVAILLVEVVGRTRELPHHVDCSLSLKSKKQVEEYIAAETHNLDSNRRREVSSNLGKESDETFDHDEATIIESSAAFQECACD